MSNIETPQPQAAQPQNATVDSGSGFITGVTPPQHVPQQQATNGLIYRDDRQQEPQTPQQRMFTEEQVESFRQQEKDKLYPEIQRMSEQLRTLQEERDAERAERERVAQEAESERRAKEEQEMDLRQLLDQRTATFQQQIEERDRRYEADRAVFEQERRLTELNEYRRDRLEQEGAYIFPELQGFITGNSPEEVDASIEALKERTASILNQITAAQPPPQPFSRVAANPGVPPVGPLEQLPSYEQLSPQDIAAMPMDTYKRHRDELLRAASQQRRQGR
jgi:hypothetical protein